MSTTLFETEWRVSAGQALEAFGRRVTPLTRALIVRGRSVWVWDRPYALQVQRGEERELLPIADATLRLQCLALGAGLALAWLLVGALRRRERR